jgi:hypothetical protein
VPKREDAWASGEGNLPPLLIVSASIRLDVKLVWSLFAATAEDKGAVG